MHLKHSNHKEINGEMKKKKRTLLINFTDQAASFFRIGAVSDTIKEKRAIEKLLVA